ncbi:family 16 glycosyl hydrolase [Microdochium bolleyi]|uniref:Family 16 glycosyl hydrolase n=1 Tax=Microdochium bolleyi TaxID=196109 RepID=A0A136IY89_9PEZI|nr:family 16 glycosyl hydrolase [Microdochium bolleyi]
MHVQEWAPGYAGYTKVWEESFWGNAGQGVNEGNWNIITDINVNNELQKYTRSSENLQISGGGTVQLVPRFKNGQWTSGRIESKYVFTPQAGRRTMAEARLRFGNAPQANKRGMWPAFWLLGDSIRHGVQWPACGEIDVMERINGEWSAFGTLHCDVYGGGACNTPTGISQRTGLANDDWHNWRVVWDRTPSNWRDQTMTWSLDGNQFHQISGARLNNEAAWRAVAQSPVFFILNLAIGGNLPGNPDGNTWDAYGNMMEVSYVAHHVSS